MTPEAEALFAAVRSGDGAQVREILARSPGAARASDGEGATPLHYAAEAGDRAIVRALLDAGADVNARDGRFDATPAGWAIEYLRQRGGLLAIEIEDAALAIEREDADLLRQWLSRAPALRDAVGRDGTPLRERARRSGDPRIRALFGADA